MKSLFYHFKFLVVQSMRLPGYFFFTAIIPSIFYYFFARPEIQNPQMANVILASFVCFSFITETFLQFSVQVCYERKSTWRHFIETLPGPIWTSSLARVFNTILFSSLGALVVTAVVFNTADPDLTASEIILLLFSVSLSSLPFFFMAYLLAHFVSRQAISTAATATYLLLSIAGGMLIPPSGLPGFVKDLSQYLPTRHMVEVAWSVVERSELDLVYVGGLSGYSIGLFLIIIFLKKKNLV